MTGQRMLILETLESFPGHPTAEDLYEAVQPHDHSIHLSTVYRTLRWLEQVGLVSGRRFEEERRQERFDIEMPKEHYHFVCSVCNQVIEFHDILVDEVRERFIAETGVEVSSTSMVLYGVCSRCKQE
jgi:Fe2+ or Zn2+ uptake regulation protein